MNSTFRNGIIQYKLARTTVAEIDQRIILTQWIEKATTESNRSRENIELNCYRATNKHLHFDRVCGVGRMVDSDNRGLWFESSQSQISHIYLQSTVIKRYRKEGTY